MVGVLLLLSELLDDCYFFSVMADNDDMDGRIDSPSISSPSSGRVFDGSAMNKALALRINKDLKNKRVFLFGDITMKQGLEIFKKLHKNLAADAVVDTLLPIDFSVNFEEMKVCSLFFFLLFHIIFQ